MTAIVKHRRILLKEWFVVEDVRREEAVTQVGSGSKSGVAPRRITKIAVELYIFNDHGNYR